MISKRISKLLELKQFTKDIYESELKKTQDSLQAEKIKLKAIEKVIEETKVNYHQSQHDGSINIQELEFYYNYLLHMNRQAEKQKNIISNKIIDVQRKKDKLIEANKEKQMVETIHNRLLKKEEKEADKKEQKEIDLNFLYNKNRK